MINNSTQHVNVKNPLDVSYIKGDDDTDGSQRFIIDSLDNLATLQTRQNGVWNPSELKLSQGSLFLGREVTLAAAGHHLLLTESVDEVPQLVIAQNFEDTGTEAPVSTAADVKQFRVVGQSDNSSPRTLTDHSSALSPVTDESIVTKLYIQTGSVAASADVSIVLSHGTSPNDAISFQQNFPASAFPANSEVEIDVLPGDGFSVLVPVNLTISSPTAFTLLYDTTDTFLWFALDDQQIVHEEMLVENFVLTNDLGLVFNNNLDLTRANPVFP